MTIVESTEMYFSAAIRILRFPAAIAGGLSSIDQTVNNSRGAADPPVYMKGTKGAVVHASPAFHALVPVKNSSLYISYGQNSVRAHLDAGAAAFASFRNKFKCRHVKQVFHSTPHWINLYSAASIPVTNRHPI